ncbi:hypothetical protein NAB22_18200 [Proteus mirabilis]|nr:hypothetical protein [Proteus mirabilis]
MITTGTLHARDTRQRHKRNPATAKRPYDVRRVATYISRATSRMSGTHMQALPDPSMVQSQLIGRTRRQ